MDAALYRAPHAGEVIRTLAAYAAFVPAPLPPEIHYDSRLVLALSCADAALGELSGLGRQLPNPHLLITPYLRREAVMSSRIEGTRASLSDVFRDEAEAGLETAPADVREVRNYVAAMEHGLRRLGDLPLSLRLVREIHERLMQGVRGGAATPGEFRRSQNWTGPPGSTLTTAPYVPPPPDEMLVGLRDWERFLHDRETMPDLVQCALMHEQFEAIHPFLDGNGRVGRLLIVLFLIERGRLSEPLLYLSDYIEAHRDEYIDLLQQVRTHGDWESWLHFFLVGVAESATAATRQAGRLMGLRETFRSRVIQKPKALALVDHLFVNPYVTVARAAHLLQTSNQTARQAVITLQASNILEEITGRSWGRLYLARSILDAIQGD